MGREKMTHWTAVALASVVGAMPRCGRPEKVAVG